MAQAIAHWRATLEPYATIWSAVLEHARGCGLVHGQMAVDLVTGLRDGHARGPADAYDTLADMVEGGVLQPVQKDLAGVSHSVRAFRTLTYGKSLGCMAEWCRPEAGLWTYTAK
jgi:hypothetical protein